MPKPQLTFEEERELIKLLQPYEDMLRATAWSSGFKYALTHPEAEKVLDDDVTTLETREGFYCAKRYLYPHPILY